eukprot:SAG22_NODE_8952_length_619_cov_0.794231_2_plen_56_part_00
MQLLQLQIMVVNTFVKTLNKRAVLPRGAVRSLSICLTGTDCNLGHHQLCSQCLAS